MAENGASLNAIIATPPRCNVRVDVSLLLWWPGSQTPRSAGP